ncbi:MAG: AAA family ATPase [Candidatus Aegiribacteria sp.]|nr:AAA family ATPase [Candidatus Aegiribacteria sp.]
MSKKTRLQKAITTLEEKRDELGSEIVDIALIPLREKLESISNSNEKKLRKYVTVLFADISDFTKICESHDAEYVTEALNYLWTALDSIIIKHGGVIDKHIGDAVMALWGTETVRENDTERTIKAALEMQASAEKILPDPEKGIPKFKMRIGVHSGPVFLGRIGLKGEYTAMGDTVNIASRLYSSAPLGSVIVSHDSYGHVRNSFVFESRDPIEVKGVTDPLKTYVAVSANPKRFQQINTGILGIETEMIGRDEELQVLISALGRTMLESTPGMITIIGEAGIGKSRLLHEFRKRVERENDDMIFFNARCTPEMKNTPCSVFRDILKYRMNVRENDSTEVAWKKFEAEMGEYLTKDEVLLACHYAGFDFSSYEPVRRLMGTQALAATGRSCLVNYFRGTAADNRTMIYLEDLHWADNTSLELIEHLAGNITDDRLLILSLSRPPLLETHPHWGEGLPHRFIELKPLSEKYSGDLTREILKKVDSLPVDITNLVVSGSGGNPFYMEELIAMLMEDGVIVAGEDKWTVKPGSMIRKTVPSTLTGVLQARLDSLPDEEKQMLQKASVIGRLFWDLALENLYKKTTDIDSMLSLLQSRDLIHGNDNSTFTLAREYLFKHAILRDVTYDTVLLELRKTYHRKIAEWIVNNSGDRVFELSGLIAEHYDRGCDRKNALEWLLKSGRSAYSTSSFAEALSAFQRALSIVPEGNENLSQLHLDTGNTLEKLAKYDEACEQLERALEIAEEEDEQDIAAKSLLTLTWIAILRGQIDHAKELSLMAFERAEKSGSKSILAKATMRMADFDNEKNYDNVLSYYRKSYRIYKEIGDINGTAITRLNMGNVAMSFDQLQDAEEYYTESLKTYESLGNQWGIANCLGNLGNVSLIGNDYNKSRELHKRSIAISRKIGDREGEVICNLNLGHDTKGLGSPEESKKHYCRALKTAASLGLLPLALSALHELSKIMLDNRELENAALALLFIKENEEVFLVEGESTDIDGLLSNVLDKLPDRAKGEIKASAESLELVEVANRILQKIGTEAF